MFSFADVSFSALIFFEFLWNECTHQGHKSSNIGIYFQGSSKSLWIPYAILIVLSPCCILDTPFHVQFPNETDEPHIIPEHVSRSSPRICISKIRGVSNTVLHQFNHQHSSDPLLFGLCKQRWLLTPKDSKAKLKVVRLDLKNPFVGYIRHAPHASAPSPYISREASGRKEKRRRERAATTL
eukprot:g30753.t1